MVKYDIAYDIGHGSDTWVNGGGKGVRKGGKVYEEHEANSDVAKRAIKILEAHGLKVWLPQKPYSKDVSLRTRTNEANKLGIKLYWSTHFNAGVPNAKGVCAFYWHSNNSGKALAQLFAQNAKAMGFPTHGDGTHASNYNSWTNLHIVRETKMTAVLTENGFMTHPDDFKGIFGADKGVYRQRVAELHAKTILSFFGKKYDSGKAPVDNVKPNPSYTLDKTDRLGEVELLAEMNYRTEPDLKAKVIKVLPKGHGSNGRVHFYEEKGHWLRLGTGWVSNAGGKYVKITERYSKTPQPTEPKKSVYRVIVNGEQVGAYSEDSNILAEIKQAMKHLKEDITIERV